MPLKLAEKIIKRRRPIVLDDKVSEQELELQPKQNKNSKNATRTAKEPYPSKREKLLLQKIAELTE